MSNLGTRAELVEILKLYYQDYEYRHKTFWEIVFKSSFAIVGLIGLPFFLLKESFLIEYIYLFPVVSCVLSIFSMLLLKSEGVRVEAVRKKYTTLMEQLSSNYKQIPIGTLTNLAPLKYKIVNQVMLLYVSLIFISFVQIVLIVTGRFS